MGAYKKHDGRRYYFDMTNIKADYTFLHANACSRKKARELRRLDPYAHTTGPYRKYKTPKDLQKHVDEYFRSCMMLLRNKDGEVVYQDDKPVYVNTKPFTISGLALFLGITTNTLRTYQYKAKAGLIPPEYADVVLRARQKIEEFAEGQLYSRDGNRGGEFVLRAAFGWQTKGERQINKLNKKKLKMQQSEQKLKQQALALGVDEDNTVEIRITRADKRPENMEDDE